MRSLFLCCWLRMVKIINYKIYRLCCFNYILILRIKYFISQGLEKEQGIEKLIYDCQYISNCKVYEVNNIMLQNMQKMKSYF